jgi:predicted anti-sigma-YlaC factor YlaD
VKCSACKARLMAHIDGDTSLVEREAIERHLAVCESCRAEASALREVEMRLERLQPIEPRGDLTLAVMAAVSAMPAPKPARLQLRWFAGYLAAAWLLLIGATQMHLINWQRAFAATGTEFGKLGAAAQTLAHVAGNLHVGAIAAGAVGFELIVLVLGVLLVRPLVPRISNWLAGATI